MGEAGPVKEWVGVWTLVLRSETWCWQSGGCLASGNGLYQVAAHASGMWLLDSRVCANGPM